MGRRLLPLCALLGALFSGFIYNLDAQGGKLIESASLHDQPAIFNHLKSIVHKDGFFLLLFVNTQLFDAIEV